MNVFVFILYYNGRKFSSKLFTLFIPFFNFNNTKFLILTA